MNVINLIKKYYFMLFDKFFKKYKEIKTIMNRDQKINDLINSLKLLLKNIDSKDFQKIDIGWNSANTHIATPNNRIIEDVGDLDKFCSRLNNLNNERVNSTFLSNGIKVISVTNYFLDKNNEIVDVDVYVKKLSKYCRIILNHYIEELEKPESNNQFKLMIINQILKSIKITLESLSSMK